LDIPRKSGSLEIMQDLEKATLDHGGRVYLAKDAVLSSSGFRKMYPNIEQFAAVLEQIDPGRRFQSDMAVRLGLRTGR
ncbi:MAG: decaprenylphosphoryl-beta-D-ribose oxidase, partial [Gammaproteobacteria bacterium]|nr:decaprenylphosphoryl-beta-D-ribose oxidase [Gammaproteobacteria bacterium]